MHDARSLLRFAWRYDPLMQSRVAATGVHVYRSGPDDQFFLLNKHDGTIRILVPES